MEYRRFIFLGIIVISLGVTFSTVLKAKMGSFGTVLIAVGGLLFLIGMNKKRLEEEKKKL